VATYPAPGGGYRVNWREFAQFRDDTLAIFYERGRTAGLFGDFQVVAQRGHYFGDKAPELPGGTVCLKLLGSRAQDGDTEAFVAAGSQAWRALEPLVGFDQMARLKIRIQWADRGDGQVFPVVTQVVEPGWFGWGGGSGIAGN
jgi:hypothetical protein